MAAGGRKIRHVKAAAFTLVEVMAVVVLLGLAAAATAWSMAGEARQRASADAIDRIAHADGMARSAARRLGTPFVLRVDLERQQIVRASRPEGSATHAQHIGPALRIDRVMIAQTSGVETAEARVIERGSVEIAYSTAGACATWAARLVNDETDKARWLVCAGLTGQMSVIDHDEQIEQILAMLTGSRPDAH